MTTDKTTLYESLEFLEWTPEVEERIQEFARRLTQWRGAGASIRAGGLGPFDTAEGDIQTVLEVLKDWIETTLRHCQEIAAIGASDYVRLVFAADFDGRMFNIMPMMEGGLEEDQQRYTEAAAYIVCPRKNLYRFYGSNNASWQEWKDRERRWKENPEADFVNSDEAARFETEEQPGRTYYIPE